MVSVNPFAEFREECETALRESLVKSYPQISIHKIRLESPPSPEFGELASSLCGPAPADRGARPPAGAFPTHSGARGVLGDALDGGRSPI